MSINFVQAFSVGLQILSAVASLTAGQPSQPFRIGSAWFTLQEVPAPGSVKP